jgi:hypothetical protein
VSCSPSVIAGSRKGSETRVSFSSLLLSLIVSNQKAGGTPALLDPSLVEMSVEIRDVRGQFSRFRKNLQVYDCFPNKCQPRFLTTWAFAVRERNDKEPGATHGAERIFSRSADSIVDVVGASSAGFESCAGGERLDAAPPGVL